MCVADRLSNMSSSSSFLLLLCWFQQKKHPRRSLSCSPSLRWWMLDETSNQTKQEKNRSFYPSARGVCVCVCLRKTLARAPVCISVGLSSSSRSTVSNFFLRVHIFFFAVCWCECSSWHETTTTTAGRVCVGNLRTWEKERGEKSSTRKGIVGHTDFFPPLFLPVFFVSLIRCIRRALHVDFFFSAPNWIHFCVFFFWLECVCVFARVSIFFGCQKGQSKKLEFCAKKMQMWLGSLICRTLGGAAMTWTAMFVWALMERWCSEMAAEYNEWWFLWQAFLLLIGLWDFVVFMSDDG